MNDVEEPVTALLEPEPAPEQQPLATPGPAPVQEPPSRKRWRVDPAVVVSIACITGILAFIALPNLLQSIQRSKQKRTMSDMRSLGTALGSYQVDYNGYPTGDDLAQIFALLDPKYIVAPPLLDGWGQPWIYEVPEGNGTFASSYTITSRAANEVRDGVKGEIIRYFECDIVYNDGQFIQSPEGIMKSSDERILHLLDLDTSLRGAPEADQLWASLGKCPTDAGRVSEAARAMMAAKNPSASAAEIEGMALRFERDLAWETIRNDLLLHAELHEWLALGGREVATLDPLDDRVQRDIFYAAGSDPSAGLAWRSSTPPPHRWMEEGSDEEGSRPEGGAGPGGDGDRSSPVRTLALDAASNDPGVADRAVEALRRAGPAGLQAFLDVHGSVLDAAARLPRSARPAPAQRLLDTLDAIAMQRDAHAARLFWYTDLHAALRAAAASGKPVLSLRLLGRLDEELSCVNSRFFRTTLYVDPEVREALSERFVLHWHSVRPIPKVTIDFGDGRILKQTIAGNSIHYVLDLEGRPVEALPGMTAPAAFAAWLERAGALAGRTSGRPEGEKDALLREYHRGRLALLAEARAGKLEALDLALFTRAGLPVGDPYLGTAPVGVFTGIDEGLTRPDAADR